MMPTPAPESWKSLAQARPMPEEPPVMATRRGRPRSVCDANRAVSFSLAGGSPGSGRASASQSHSATDRETPRPGTRGLAVRGLGYSFSFSTTSTSSVP